MFENFNKRLFCLFYVKVRKVLRREQKNKSEEGKTADELREEEAKGWQIRSKDRSVPGYL